MHNFKELRIWQQAMEIALKVYEVTAKFPDRERFGLISQINRAAVSILSNIAEGAGRGTDKDFCNFLRIALGSSFELETQLILAHQLGYISQETFDLLSRLLSEEQKMINTLHKGIQKRINL